MSNAELIVIVLGLCGGYWMVANYLGKTPRSPADEGPPADQDVRGRSANEEQKIGDPWYVVLNVSREASGDEIRRAYKVLMGQYHPDKVAALGDELKSLAENKSKEITRAYREAMLVRSAEM